MPKYRVLEPGFYGGILRKPGGRHDPVVTARPIPKKKMPAWLELIDEEAEAQVAAESDAARDEVIQKDIDANLQKNTEINESSENFMGERRDDDTAGVESL